jgi:hypothetical protein
MGIKRYPLILGFLIIGSTTANASCTQKTCVDVFTDQNQLVITAQKGAVKPTPKPTPKPAPKAVTPKPVVVVTKPPTPKAAAPKTVVKKVAAPKPATASLSDKLIKLLPAGDINFQPTTQSVVNIPTYFWTQTPERFQAVVPILDVIVYVNLYSTLTWSFGDGTEQTTLLRGGPFPNPSVGLPQRETRAAGCSRMRTERAGNRPHVAHARPYLLKAPSLCRCCLAAGSLCAGRSRAHDPRSGHARPNP